ncbi:MAG: PAS domain S-box protein [Bacteroidota bacterium]
MKKIVLVEDDPFQAKIFEKLLVSNGYEIIGIYSTGDEAIEKLRNVHPDIILMDIMMPGQNDGIQAITKIKKFKHVPFIYLTGVSDRLMFERAKKTNPYGYIIKPVEENRFVITIDIALSKFETELQLKKKSLELGMAIQSLEGQINEKEEAQILLRDTIKDYQSVIRNIQDVFFRSDNEGVLTSVSPSGAEFFGFNSTEEMIGLDISDHLYLNKNDRIPFLNRLYQNGFVKNYEIHVKKNKNKDKVAVISSNAHLLYDADGKVVGVEGIFRDVTEQKKMERALRKSEEDFRSIFENSPIGMYRTTADGKIIMANSTLVNLLGYEFFKEIQNLNLENEAEYRSSVPRSLFKQMLSELGVVYGLESVWHTQNRKNIQVREYAREVRNRDGVLMYYEGTIEDVSDRKKIEDDLRKSEEHFRNIFENSPIGIYRTTPAGKVVMANSALALMLGYADPNELMQIDLENDKIHNQRNERDNFKFKIESEGAIVGLESVWFKKDCTPITVRENSKLFRDKKGVPLYYEGTIEDVSEKKNFEKTLKESEEKYRTIFENIQDVYLEMDLDGFITEVSPSVENVLNYTKEELVNKPVSILLKNLTDRQRILNKLFKDGEIVDAELVVMNKNAQVKYCSFSAKFYQEQLSDSKKVVGTLRDISIRKNIELALMQSEELYRKLISQLPDMVFIHRNGTVLFINEVVVDTLGYTKDEIVGESMLHFINNPYKKIVSHTINKRINLLNVREIEIVSKSGKVHIVATRGEKIIYEGQEAILTVITDITQLKNLEKKYLTKIIQIQEQERKRFAEEIHDGLGPLLSSINIYVNMLSSYLNKNDEKIKLLIENTNDLIKEAVNNARSIANNIMPSILNDYGMVTALKSYISKINTSEALNIIFETKGLEERINQKIEINIYRVVMELINNTLKHAKAKHINIKLTRQKNKLILFYLDDGVGINPRKLLNPDSSPSMGIFNIQSRVKSINGIVKFNEKAVSGFCVEIEVEIVEF